MKIGQVMGKIALATFCAAPLCTAVESEGWYSTYFSQHYEAESASTMTDCGVENEDFPYVGDGYVVMGEKGSLLEWDQIKAPEAGTYTLIIKYANASKQDLPAQIMVNGQDVGVENFASVCPEEWKYYWNARVRVDLRRGNNKIAIQSASDQSGLRIDNIAISELTAVDPQRSIDVRDHGAKGDGESNDTEAIQAAIDACQPGCALVLKDGVFMSGHIRLKSDMTLWIDETATLKSIQDKELYPDNNLKAPNNVASYAVKSFIYAEGAENVRISGGGIIDGNAAVEYWSNNRKMKEHERPIPIYLAQGKNVMIQNVDITWGAMWTVVPYESDDVIVDGINVKSTWGKNKDGIDLIDCHQAKVLNSVLMVEDDAMCPKSGSDRGCEDILYRNITVNYTQCGGAKLGTDTYGHFKNITFEDISVYGSTAHKKSNVAINVSTVDGADISNITIRRANMYNMSTGVFIMNGACVRGRRKGTGKALPEKEGSKVEGIVIEDVDIRACHDRFGNWISGTKTDAGVYPVTDVVLKNVRIECMGGEKKVPSEPKEYNGKYPNYNWCKGILPVWGYYIRHAQDIAFENCSEILLKDDARERLMIQSSTNVSFDGKVVNE